MSSLLSSQQPSKRQKRDVEFRALLSSSFDAIHGGGLLRHAEDNSVDFVESVKRMAVFVPTLLSATPVFEYELLTEGLRCQASFKLENLQKLGDVFSRCVMSIIISHYLNQRDRIGLELSEVPTVVMVLDPSENIQQLQMLPIVLVSLLMKSVLKQLRPAIFVVPGTYSLAAATHLFMCAKAGAELYFPAPSCSSSNSNSNAVPTAATDREAVYARARQFAADRRGIFVEPAYNRQFAVIGAATLAAEMLAQEPNAGCVVLPLRLYSVGWMLVYAVAFYVKIVSPATRVVVAQLETQLGEKDGVAFQRSIFPDLLETGWQSLSRDASGASTHRQIFDLFDWRNQGSFTPADLSHVLAELGAPPAYFRTALGKEAYSLTEFIQQLNGELLHAVSGSFVGFMTLKNLQERGLVDDLVRVTEDEAALAFLRCLLYTKTLTNGKGALALAALAAGRVKPLTPQQRVLSVLSGGYIDAMDFQSIFEYAMGLTGQHFSLDLEMPDNSLALSRVLKVIADNGVSVREAVLNREAQAAVYHVKVQIQGYSRSFQQHQHIHEQLAMMGYDCSLDVAAPVLANGVAPTLTFPPVSAGSGNVAVPAGIPAVNSASASAAAAAPAPLSASSSAVPVAGGSTYVKRSIDEITPESIRAAYERIRHNIYKTPLILSDEYSRLCGCQVYLKLDNVQKTGSFKMRGSSNAVLRQLEAHVHLPGLIAASAGNHAQGVALVARKVGLPCLIVCPNYAPETKLAAVRQYGAEVIKAGESFEEAVRESERLGVERRYLQLRAFNDVDIIEGQGTIGLEVHNELPDVDTVIVNVGGGGMIAGIALYLKRVNPRVRIIGVQAQNVAPLADFKQTEELRFVEPMTVTLADGVNVKLPGGVHTHVLRDLVDEYVTVRENEIAATIVHLLEFSRTLSEGAGCLGLAALLYGKIRVRPDEKVCVVVCGGNIDMSTLRQIYEYGLRALGREFTVHLTMPDAPGSLAKVVGVAAGVELKVQEVRHIRGMGEINWNEVTLSLTFYSNSFQHQIQFLLALVERRLFPQLIGREFIKDHQTIYRTYDVAVEKKRKEIEEEFKQKAEQFHQTQIGKK